MSLNKIFLHGRLARIPELRKTQAGKSVCTFSIAVDRDSASRETDFINCVAWEKRAEFASSYFTKGQEALIAGSLNMRSFTDKSGVHRTVAEVIVDKMDFCGPKHAARDRDGEERTPAAPARDPFADVERGRMSDITDDDGDLPF